MQHAFFASAQFDGQGRMCASARILKGTRGVRSNTTVSPGPGPTNNAIVGPIPSLPTNLPIGQELVLISDLGFVLVSDDGEVLVESS